MDLPIIFQVLKSVSHVYVSDLESTFNTHNVVVCTAVLLVPIVYIVYGWINAGRVERVQEEGPGQMFEVGYLKTGAGTPPWIELTVEDVEGTASMFANAVFLLKIWHENNNIALASLNF